MVRVVCPSCDGQKFFVGVGASSVCRRCCGVGFLEFCDSISSVVEASKPHE